ncbi:MAG: hypothetical protein ACK5WZ_01490 [Pseudobdellovibrionaceae bacterium]
MPILFLFVVVEIILYSLWISYLGLGSFVFMYLFQTFFGFLLLSSIRSIYYKSIAVFHILPIMTLRMLGLILLIPFHLVLGDRLKRKMNSRFQSNFQNQKHFQFIFKNYGTHGQQGFGASRVDLNDLERTLKDHLARGLHEQQNSAKFENFNGENFDQLKDVTPIRPKPLSGADKTSSE